MKNVLVIIKHSICYLSLIVLSVMLSRETNIYYHRYTQNKRILELQRDFETLDTHSAQFRQHFILLTTHANDSTLCALSIQDEMIGLRNNVDDTESIIRSDAHYKLMSDSHEQTDCVHVTIEKFTQILMQTCK